MHTKRIYKSVGCICRDFYVAEVNGKKDVVHM